MVDEKGGGNEGAQGYSPTATVRTAMLGGIADRRIALC